ncbi:hypothetical protein A3H53_01205 [Candidatus Nomurabacteria bacterium RIFCSPLOWO2_02_FULL_40_10]|uniref:Uncharacterized protein n=1 Tax=Candidatus Nomurabacteria bacterium RIFCSPLOWO2_02_FULL_40_10 TaxID=1801786 RepID=A0A1F6XWV9_9BACT|nr:MAG: hypothetical protein A3H53_01205 [Candidatus Nomurabacteria bacterium RIFCSPLOWO2_02_FULL_40_10]
MSHYICTGGCKGESVNPGVCQTSTCLDYTQPLKECDCEDGKHYGSFEEEKDDNSFDDKV